MKKKLGRGLGAILQEVEKAYDSNMGDNSDLIVELDCELIKPNPFQPRKKFNDESLKELSASIKEHGLLQPILVYEEDNEYFLIAGERRLRASKMAKINTIKAIIVADIDTAKLKEIALIENIQREDLNPIDLAYAYQSLIEDFKLTQDELAKKVQKSRPQITNTLALLKLPKQAKDSLIDGKITQGHAKILVNLDEDSINLALDSIIGQKLSVGDSEKLVANLKHRKIKKNNIIKLDKSALIELKSALNAINIKSSINKNGVSLIFSDSQKVKEFTKILEKMRVF